MASPSLSTQKPCQANPLSWLLSSLSCIRTFNMLLCCSQLPSKGYLSLSAWVSSLMWALPGYTNCEIVTPPHLLSSTLCRSSAWLWLLLWCLLVFLSVSSLQDQSVVHHFISSVYGLYDVSTINKLILCPDCLESSGANLARTVSSGPHFLPSHRCPGWQNLSSQCRCILLQYDPSPLTERLSLLWWHGPLVWLKYHPCLLLNFSYLWRWQLSGFSHTSSVSVRIPEASPTDTFLITLVSSCQMLLGFVPVVSLQNIW